MKMKYKLWMLVAGIAGWMGCSDDSGTLEPSNEQEYKVELTGGNHDYDTKIKNWNDRTGVYILYKFDPREVYFNGNSTWTNIYMDTIVESVRYYPLGENVYVEGEYVFINGEKFVLGWSEKAVNARKEHVELMENEQVRVRTCKILIMGSISVEEAEEEYVGRQLEWVEEMFLNFYPDPLLRETMPMKVILGKELIHATATTLQRAESYYYTFHNLIFSHGDGSVETLSLKEKCEIKTDVNIWFVGDRLKPLASFEEFWGVTSYPSTFPANSEIYKLGLLSSTMLPSTDVDTYLKVIMGNSYAKLTAEPPSGDYVYDDFTGILHPKKDVNGLIRQKYDILINEFKKIGVDLQAIGNLYN